MEATIFKLSDLFFKLSSIRSFTFDWKYFESLQNPNEIYDYALQNLEMVEEPGTGRTAFIFSSKWVLKIANPENLLAGIAQNKNELDFSLDSNLRGLVAKVVDHHPENIWIKSQLVRPVFDLDELLKLLQLESPKDMMFLFGKFPEKQMISKSVSPIAAKISQLVRSGILGHDVMKSDSWGVTTDGQPVLLDYGMTKQTYKEFYAKSK